MATFAEGGVHGERGGISHRQRRAAAPAHGQAGQGHGGHLTFTQYTYILDMGLGKHHVHAVGGSTTQRGLRGLRASMPKRMAPASRYDAVSPGGRPPICCDPRARRPQQCLQISCRSRAGVRMADSSGRGGLAIPSAAGRAAATARRWGRWCKNRPVNVDSHRNRADSLADAIAKRWIRPSSRRDRTLFSSLRT